MKSFVHLLSVITLGLAATFAVAVESTPGPAAKAEMVAQQGAININTADVAELTKLKGIGVKKAEAIIAWREANGEFESVDQLIEVKGIGESTLMQNRENISI